MQIISQFVPLPLADPAQGTAVAMGYFDGIHIGHRAVIDGAVQWARAHGAAPAVFTFRLPVDNKMKGKRLLSSADKHALIASLGVEYYLTPDFEEIKGLSPEQFVRSIVENCHAKALFCGENFTFGAKAAGTPELLRKLCAPLGVEVDFTGEYNALIVVQQDKPGVVAHITKILNDRGVNIAFMRLFREEKGHTAYTIVESDERLPEGVDQLLLANPNIRDVMVVQQ